MGAYEASGAARVHTVSVRRMLATWVAVSDAADTHDAIDEVTEGETAEEERVDDNERGDVRPVDEPGGVLNQNFHNERKGKEQ